MLFFHSCNEPKGEEITDFTASAFPDDAIWVDLIEPSEDEIQFVEKLSSLSLPTIEGLSEIETSSRLSIKNDALFMSTPLVSKSESAAPEISPVGFILSEQRLITIRYSEFVAFEAFQDELEKDGIPHPSGLGIFVCLADAIINRLADVLEKVGDELAAVSRRAFHTDPLSAKASTRPATRENADMRVILRRIGRAGDLASVIRDSLLGVNRMIAYVSAQAEDWTPDDVEPLIAALREDANSLNDYIDHLTDKVQLLLDATLGFISIEQNNTFRILTIVSVVGIPPTLIASLYGMNFKHMPELEWMWGYPFGLGLIAISAIIPLIWFKLRGWS